jgi:hypothetical protein
VCISFGLDVNDRNAGAAARTRDSSVLCASNRLG